MTLFTIETREFGWNEIVVAAEAWGEWTSFAERVRHSLACLRLAKHTNQLPSNDQLRETATAFRYAHILISAEETKLWLEHWEMTVDDWMNCLRSQVLSKRWAGRLNDIAGANPVADAEVA